MYFVACLYKNPVQDYSKDLVVKRNLPRPMYCYHYLVIWPLSLNGICTSQKKGNTSVRLEFNDSLVYCHLPEVLQILRYKSNIKIKMSIVLLQKQLIFSCIY